jgi:hypothetical protein
MELLGDKMGTLAFMNLFLVVYKEIARNDQSFPGEKKKNVVKYGSYPVKQQPLS